jgi:hypothetical protein
MNPELLAAIKLLAAFPDRAVVLKGLQDEAAGLRHEIFQAGHDVGYGKGKAELKTATDTVTELQGKLTKADADLVEARKANPDVAKIHEGYQTQLKAKDEELLAERGKAKAERIAGAGKDLETQLIGLGVEKTMAKMQAREHADRLTLAEDGTLQVLQPGLVVPYAPSGEKSGMVQLAEAIRAKVPALYIVSGADGGSGDQGAGGGQALTGQAKLIDDIRKKAETERAAKAAKPAGSNAEDALSRMAVRSA